MTITPRRQYILPATLISVLAILIFSGVGNAQNAKSETGTVRGAVATAGPDGQSYNIPGASLKLKRGMQVAEELESLIVMAKGHGTMSSVVEERRITAALVVLRQNGTALITVTADLLLQAEGTWKATASSPEEILLRITGGVLKGEMSGSGKLLLTSDRKSIKELTINLTSSDGQEISVTFVADNSEAPVKGYESEAPSRTWLGLEEGPGELCKSIPPRCR